MRALETLSEKQCLGNGDVLLRYKEKRRNGYVLIKMLDYLCKNRLPRVCDIRGKLPVRHPK